ncbi:ABC transporter permease [Propionicimonas sp.]|uniref:ABC transporter permease n=1 Tax=Propionicimonas sp. TaxID=1955623 RepID=UPI0039E64695
MTLSLAWRYLRGRGARSLLTTLAVVFGVMLTFGLNGILPAMTEAFTHNLLSAAGKVDLTVTSAYNQPFRPDVVDTVLRVPQVQEASPGVQRAVPLPQSSDVSADAPAQLMVVGIDLATAEQVHDYPLASGRMLTAGDNASVMMNADLADELGLGLADRLVLPAAGGTTRFTVVGLLSTATVPGQEQVYLTLPAAQQLLGFGDRITQVEAVFASGADRTRVEQQVAAALGPDYQVGGLSTESTLLASLQTAQVAFNMFGIFALATAGFIIANSFRTVVAERRRDIGMLRAIGARRGTIMQLFLAESVFQGIIGTALGITAGWLMAIGYFAAMGPLVESFIHIRIAGPVFTPATWLSSILLGVGVTVVAALLPARAAGRVTPLEAMRPQLGEVYERRVGRRAWIGAGLVVASLFGLTSGQSNLIGLGAVVFLIGFAMVAPAVVNPIAQWASHPLELLFSREGPIARSNLQRNPGRSGITVTAVMLGLASIVATISMVSSIFAGFTSYLDKSLSSDYLLIPQSIILGQGNVAAGPRLAAQVNAVPGIGAVSTLRLGQATSDGGDVQVFGIDPDTYLGVADFDWNTGSSDAAVTQLASGRWVIANGIYATQHNLVVGQAIALDTPNGPRTYHLAGIGNDYLNAKLSTLYTSRVNLERDFAVTADMLVMANRTAGADAGTTKALLSKVVADYPAFRLYESESWRAEQMKTFDSTIVIFDVLVAALALPSLLALVNTLAISVLARTREIGMLRAVGATRRQIRRMVMAESLLLSVIGTGFGAIAGIWLGYALVAAMSALGWQMPYAFPWSGLLATVVVGIVFGVLAALGPARSASRLDVVAALHQE